ncbi:DUF4233 domain-containing protein [Lipingzhangella sp. LS1_29]|uniref:DUF4233 domain-containing protein n=1 Tax=Lipingzhangella rawalii TaxID=2055835 RepID=A0ABU2H935_9ACTN|nr:DUF4233 domain-containing protein [Lipingzhangella rawalii]MDS1271114.1 DUF4233 domain-containing protein [Lipingzhangella rawalii]
MRTLCAVVLAFESLVLALAVPVAIQLAGLSGPVGGGVWGGLALAALVLACLQRHTWAMHAGTALHIIVVTSGLIVPGMLGVTLIGAIFAALWFGGMYLGRRTEAELARREQLEATQIGSDGPTGARPETDTS